MKCFYHKSDLDGHGSGAIVKHHYPECEMIGVDYGDDYSKNGIFDGAEEETIYVVDFSFPKLIMDSLDKLSDLIWIDHHKSAIEELPDRYAGAAGFKVSLDRVLLSPPLIGLLEGKI